jgi:DNA-binding NarL/FixJ family response regulator
VDDAYANDCSSCRSTSATTLRLPLCGRPERTRQENISSAMRLSSDTANCSGVGRGSRPSSLTTTFANDWLTTELAVNAAEDGGERKQTVTRILIADDHDVVRSGLRTILEAHPNWEVVAEAADGKEAIDRAIDTKPDVAVIDYSMPLINGVEVTRQIRAKLPRTEVLIFTMHDNETLFEQVLKAGARGYLLKSDAQRYLITAIESLAIHKPFFTARVSEALLQSYVARGKSAKSVLTDRERELVQLVAEGHSNKEIAHLLNISIKTVETHRSAVMHKLNFHTSAELVRYAIRNKIVEP